MGAALGSQSVHCKPHVPRTQWHGSHGTRWGPLSPAQPVKVHQPVVPAPREPRSEGFGEPRLRPVVCQLSGGSGPPSGWPRHLAAQARPPCGTATVFGVDALTYQYRRVLWSRRPACRVTSQRCDRRSASLRGSRAPTGRGWRVTPWRDRSALPPGGSAGRGGADGARGS